jgi:hypothetical protein
MTEYIPTLSVSRPVLNITQEHILPLEERLFEQTDGSLHAYQTIQGLFNPVDEFHATIIATREFTRLQHRLGRNRLGEDEIEEIGSRIETALADCSGERNVKTLPLQLERWGDGARFVLTVANSIGIIRERIYAKEVITRFLGKEAMPKSIWLPNDRKSTPIWLAFSADTDETELLNHLNDILSQEEALPPEDQSLPAITKFGKVEIETKEAKL